MTTETNANRVANLRHWIGPVLVLAALLVVAVLSPWKPTEQERIEQARLNPPIGHASLTLVPDDTLYSQVLFPTILAKGHPRPEAATRIASPDRLANGLTVVQVYLWPDARIEDEMVHDAAIFSVDMSECASSRQSVNGKPQFHPTEEGSLERAIADMIGKVPFGGSERQGP